MCLQRERPGLRRACGWFVEGGGRNDEMERAK